ncbi:MAG: efflux transporter outer membrane subunit, partial [Proteobacteria bacterium]|nr:efflux transporter outer membrane subunit [Pseudomonadota bacterium]
MPERWGTEAGDLKVQQDAEALKEWWCKLGDEKLNQLIALGIESNKDLEIARARVREARAQLGIQTAPLMPSIGATGGLSRTVRSENAALPTVTNGSSIPSAAGIHNLYSAGLDARWEIDIFGGLRNARESAVAELEAADAGLGDTYITLTAEVARAYVGVRAIEKRLSVNKKNLASQEDSLSLVQARFNAGLVSELDVSQSQTLVEQTRAQIPNLERLRREQINSLSVLLGKMPPETESILGTTATQTTDALAKLPPELPVGLPSDILRQRPDIRRAERLLAAQNARVGVAIADYFPKFSLTGNFGYLSRNS